MAYLINTGNRDWNDPLNWSRVSGDFPRDEVLGSEIITTTADRDFSSDTGFWTKGVGASITSNVLRISGSTDGVRVITKSTAVVANQMYKVTFDVSNYVSGLFKITDEILESPTFSGNGTKTIYFYFKSGYFSIVSNGSNSTFDIDNLSIKQVTSFPSSTEPAILDANSGTGTITIATTDASCSSFDASAITSAITLTSSTVSLYNYGALILDSQLTWTFTLTAYLYLKATLSVALTMNSATFNGNKVYFDGIGGTWTNSDACNLGSSSIYLTNGTWNTNGQTITTTGSFNTASGTKVLTLGASTFNVGTWNNAVPTGLTITSAGNTSTVNITATSTLTGATTFYNLTFTGVAAITAAISLAADIAVSNILTITGNNATNYRLLVASSVIGTQRTIIAATLVASNVDFRDIKLSGDCNKDLSTAVLCPGLSGDCGGNTDIIFTTAQTQYYKHTSGACTWKDPTKWFTDITPRITAGRVPLPQDSAILDANSFTGISTLTIDVPRKGSVDMSGVSYAVSTVLANGVEHYGNLILGNNITQSGDFIRHFYGDNSINSYNKTLYSINVMKGTLTLLSNLTATYLIGIVATATLLDFNDFNTLISTKIGFYYFRGGTVRLGNGTIESKSITFFNTSGTTILPENAIIKLTPLLYSDTVLFAGQGLTYNKVWFSGSHTGYFDITGANTFAEIIIDKGRMVRPVNGVTQNIAKLTAIGTQAEPITITSPTAAVHTLNTSATDIQADWLILSYSNATPANKWYAGNGSVDGGNTTGWIMKNISKGMMNFF